MKTSTQALVVAVALAGAGLALAQDNQPTGPVGPKPVDSGKYPQGAAKAESVKITHHAIQAGEARTEVGSINLEMEIVVAGQPPMSQSLSKDFTRTLSVREVDGEGKPTRVEATFTKQLEVMEGKDPTGAARRQENGKEIQGKSFVLERQADGTVVYSDPKGAGVEAFAVRRELEQAGRSMFENVGIAKAVSKAELKPGQSVAVDPKGLKILMEMPGDDGMAVEIEEFSYRGTRDLKGVKAAVFKVAIKLEPEDSGPKRGGPATRMELGGEILVSVEGGRVIGIELAGRLEFLPPPAGGGGPGFEGKGVLSVSRTTTIKRP